MKLPAAIIFILWSGSVIAETHNSGLSIFVERCLRPLAAGEEVLTEGLVGQEVSQATEDGLLPLIGFKYDVNSADTHLLAGFLVEVTRTQSCQLRLGSKMNMNEASAVQLLVDAGFEAPKDCRATDGNNGVFRYLFLQDPNAKGWYLTAFLLADHGGRLTEIAVFEHQERGSARSCSGGD